MFLARELIELAKENGADLVKFQLYDSKKLYGKKHKEELGFDDARWLFESGKSLGIEVFFSVFDTERVKWCEEIGVKRYKIAYSQRNNDILISTIPKDKFVIVSTPYDGASSELFCAYYTTYLYCVPKYPTQLSDITFTTPDSDYIWDIVDGFSDHTNGLDASKIALACGAQIIEKHFAIDHHTGVDAEWSMTPDELKELKRWEQICEQL